MIVESVLKKLVPIFLALVFASPVYSQRPDRSSSGGSNNSSTTNNSGSSSSSSSSGNSSSSNSSRNERSARPVNTRPTRPTESGNGNSHHSGSQHASSSRNEHHGHHNSYSSHHGYDDHHHHHGHGGETVVVVEEPVYYTSSYAEPVEIVEYDIDRFMLFINATGTMSFRGFADELEYEDDDDYFGKCFGYNFEARADVGLTRCLFLSPGVGYSKQSFYNRFTEFGNYMVNTKRFLEVPLMIGYRNSYYDGYFSSLSIGPRFAYGLSGRCAEHYDFYPDEERGVFEHNSYGGKYGVDRFSVGFAFEANLIFRRFLFGCGFSFFPKNDCKPTDLYEGLYGKFYNCRANINFKLGWRVF